jgi:uroporphyrinogen decarboxylase
MLVQEKSSRPLPLRVYGSGGDMQERNMKINMQEWKNSLLESKEVKALPIMSYPGLDLTGMKILDVVGHAEHQAECIERVAATYPTAAAVTMMDLSIEAEAFGAPVRIVDNDIPTVCGHIVSNDAEADALSIPAVGAARSAAAIRAVELASSRINDRPLFAMQIGPFSLAADLIGLSETLMVLMKQPALATKVLDKAVEFSIAYAKALKAAGANGTIVADMSAGLLSPKLCAPFSSAYVKKIVDAVQDENFLVVLHNCGNTRRLAPSMAETGAAGFHFGNAVKMNDVIPQMPADSLAMGNIEPSGLFRLGTPEAMKAGVAALLEETKTAKNYVLSSGCDVPLETPLVNIDAFFEALARFNAAN